MSKFFAEWLRGLLMAYNMSQAELARKAGVSPAHVSRALSGATVGEDFCRKIAKPLEIPEEVVFRNAGILTPKKVKTDERLEILVHLAEKLTGNDREELIAIAEMKLKRSQVRARYKLDELEKKMNAAESEEEAQKAALSYWKSIQASRRDRLDLG